MQAVGVNYRQESAVVEIGNLRPQPEIGSPVIQQAEMFIVTAYTHTARPGVADINGTGDGITASGLRVRKGLVAVDPRVIPLGTKVKVEGIGILLAADTGGAIKGNRLDIFLESHAEAIAFGRQKRRVTILP